MTEAQQDRMTDSNGDLVEKVAQAIWKEESVAITSIPGPDYGPARAAITAVLDDLAQDAKAMALDRTLDLIDIKRKELGL